MEMDSVVMEFSYKRRNSAGKSANRITCDWRNIIRRKIPITTWLFQYNTKYLLHDLLAGFTVALTEIPQSIAYAGIAGLPLQYGLYSSFMGGFMYAIFGSCKAINMGSTSIMALLIQSHVSTIGVDASIFMSLVGGVIILASGIMNLGFIIDFISYPVMSGFTSAASLTIASSQMKSFLGIEGQANGFLQSWQDLIKERHKINKWDAVLGTTSLLLLFALKEIGNFANLKTKNLPRKLLLMKRFVFVISVAKNAIIVSLGMTLAYYLEHKNLSQLTLTGSVDAKFPHFEFPAIANPLQIMKEFNLSLIFIPLVAILETIAIAKVFSKGKSLDGTQEMIALGIANIMGSFVQSMPVTGSFTRTAVNNASGAKSNMAAVFTGAAILTTLPFLTSTFSYIPKASLAAVIICAMFYLFEFRAFITLWRTNRVDLVPFLVTLLSCLSLSLEYGIIIGTGAHLILVLYRVARPKFKLERLTLLNYGEAYLIAPSCNIHFPASQHLLNTVLKCERKDALIIFDGKFVDHMDVTVAKSISILVSEIGIKSQKIIFVNFQKNIQNLCVKIDKRLKDYFKRDEMEDEGRPSARMNEAYSI